MRIHCGRSFGKTKTGDRLIGRLAGTAGLNEECFFVGWEFLRRMKRVFFLKPFAGELGPRAQPPPPNHGRFTSLRRDLFGLTRIPLPGAQMCHHHKETQIYVGQNSGCGSFSAQIPVSCLDTPCVGILTLRVAR